MSTSTSESRGIEVRRLLFGLLAGPLAWSGYFIVGYLVAEAACEANLLQGSAAGFSLLSLIVIALAVPFLLVSLYAARMTYRNWRALGEGDLVAREHNHFLSLSGLFLSLLFGLAILLTAAPLFVLPTCQWV